MKFFGDIQLNQNMLQKAVLEVEGDWPSLPKVGQLVFKDKIVYICVEIVSGLPAWVPLTREINTYMHMEPNPTLVWNINHNLKVGTPIVQIYDNDSKNVIPDAIEIVDENSVSITFSVPQSGRATVVTGSLEGSPRASYAYEWTQTALSNTWTITHGLGYLPIVRVFIGNAEVQPASVVHDSNFQTTITFSSPQVGMVKFI